MSAAFASASAGHVYCPLQGYQQDGRHEVSRVPGYQEDEGLEYLQNGVPGYQYQSPPTQDIMKCEKTSVTSQIVSACHGQRDCNLLADPHILGVPECQDLHVFMKATFACVDLSIFLPRFLLNSTQRERYDSTSTDNLILPSTTTSSTTTTTTSTERIMITVKTPRMDYSDETTPGPWHSTGEDSTLGAGQSNEDTLTNRRSKGEGTIPGSGWSIGEEYWWNRGGEQADSYYKGDRIYLDNDLKDGDEGQREMHPSGPVIVPKTDEDSSGLLKITSTVLTNYSYLKVTPQCHIFIKFELI